MSTNVESNHSASRITWPLRFVWRRVSAYADRAGVVRTLAVGTILAVLGYILMSTIIGALIGIPMFLIGVLFLARGLY